MNKTPSSPVRGLALWFPAVGLPTIALLLLMVATPPLVGAQSPGVGVAVKPSFPVYGRSNNLESLLTAATARSSGAGLLLLDQPRARTYAEGGRTNLEIASADCVFNPRARLATGSGAVHVQSADQRLTVDGEGFSWWQTNGNLTVSNQVRAHIHKSLRSAQMSASVPTLIAPAAEADQAAFDVQADRLIIQQQENLIICEGNVHVDDPQLALTCQSLTIKRTSKNALEGVVAEGQIVIVNRADQSRTTGERAVYVLGESGELVELSGRPKWTDGPREGTADLFLLDRPADRSGSTLRAFGTASLRLPRPKGDSADLLSFSRSATGQDPAGANQFIDVSAEMFTLQLPPTNGALRGIVAETNVVITTLDGAARATATRAAYSPDGVMELTGSPVWESQGRIVKAARLVFDPASRAFHAETNALIRLPVAGLAKSLGPTGEKPTPTNQFVEIGAEHIDYAGGWLTFSPKVHGVYLEGETSLGELNSATLKARYTNQIESLAAAGGVQFLQYPRTNSRGKTTSRNLTCETLDLRFSPEGRLKLVTADGKVLGEQLEKRPNSPKESLSKAECDRITAEMDGSSNQVHTATARGGVRLSRDDRAVTAEQAVYTGTNNLLTLTGHPLVTLPDGDVTGTDALIWNRVTGKYRFEGPFRAHWRGLQGRTNLLKLLPMK